MTKIITDNILVGNKINLNPVEPSPSDIEVLQKTGDVWYDATENVLKVFNSSTEASVIDSFKLLTGITIGDSTSNVTIDPTNGIHFNGITTVWDDLRAPATGINPIGSPSPATPNTTDGSLTFGTGNVCIAWFQMPHAYKEGSDIHIHVHWSKSTSAAGNVNWQIKYKWANIGDVMPSFTSLASGIVEVSDSNTANLHSITEWSPALGTGKHISSMICVYLTRTAAGDTYGADANLYEIDIHYEIDSLGSKDEYVK